MSITIFATVEAKAEASSQVESALRKMITPARSEAGCVRYELFCSLEKVGTFHLLETYVDEAALDSHQQSAHFTELVVSLRDLLASDIQIERWVNLEA